MMPQFGTGLHVVAMVADKACDVLLQEMFPAMCSITGELLIFQQDNAPAHHALETVALLS